MNLNVDDKLRVGARCVVGGKFRATVRYVGPVDGQAGEWVGLEWDDVSRGKHDGSHGGRRYFSCSSVATAGSFVRLGKLLEAVTFGCSLLEALQRRYCALDSSSSGDGGGITSEAASASSDMAMRTSGGQHVVVELVGAEAAAERLSDLASLQKASAVASNVATLGNDPGVISQILPSLLELDLSDNLIADWSFVTGLLSALPMLQTLNLSSNRLTLPPMHLLWSPRQLQQLPSLRTLVLNSCAVGWSGAVAAARQLPELLELRLRGNGIASLQLPAAAGAEETAETAGDTTGQQLAAALGKLQVLDLEDNAIADWEQVQLLSQLPALQALLLSGNSLPTVQYSQGFTSLSSLLLGRNQISSWSSVDDLDRFPALTDARLTDNPIVAEQGSGGRYEVIARVGRLVTLNASEVSKSERWDAELNYMRHVTDELAAAQSADESSRQRVLSRHPRFATLTAKYGTLAPSGPSPAAGSALARSLVELVLCHGGKEVRKKLPVSLTVGKLKLLIEKLLRVKATQQALLLLPPTVPAAPAALAGNGSGGSGAPGVQDVAEAAPVDVEAQPEDITDEDARELRYFNIIDGSRVEVSVADPAARTEALQRAKQAAMELHRLRMADQEKMIQQFRVVEKGLMA